MRPLSPIITATSRSCKRGKKEDTKTYNSRCSLVVTHPTTNLPVSGLSMGEQTGPRVFHYLWSYVMGYGSKSVYNAERKREEGPLAFGVDVKTGRPWLVQCIPLRPCSVFLFTTYVLLISCAVEFFSPLCFIGAAYEVGVYSLTCLGTC